MARINTREGHVQVTERIAGPRDVYLSVATQYGRLGTDVDRDSLADALESELGWRIETAPQPRPIGETFDINLASGDTHQVAQVGTVGVSDAGHLHVTDVKGKTAYVVARGDWHSFARVDA